MTDQEQRDLDILGTRFRDAVLHAYTVGKAEGGEHVKLSSSGRFQEQWNRALHLWREVEDFIAHLQRPPASQPAPPSANGKPQPASPPPAPSKPQTTSAGGVPGSKRG